MVTKNNKEIDVQNSESQWGNDSLVNDLQSLALMMDSKVQKMVDRAIGIYVDQIDELKNQIENDEDQLFDQFTEGLKVL